MAPELGPSPESGHRYCGIMESSKALGPFHIAHLWSLIAIGLGLGILSEMKYDKSERKVRS